MASPSTVAPEAFTFRGNVSPMYFVNTYLKNAKQCELNSRLCYFERSLPPGSVELISHENRFHNEKEQTMNLLVYEFQCKASGLGFRQCFLKQTNFLYETLPKLSSSHDFFKKLPFFVKIIRNVERLLYK